MINKFVFFLVLHISIIGIINATNVTQEDDDNVSAKINDPINNMLLQSISLIGIPYKWGGNTPQQGMDCSGFIRYVFKKSLGINLPRTSAEMAKLGTHIAISDMKPGDLIFFNTRRGHYTHIGMYIGNNKFIQAPHTGQDIQISELNNRERSRISLVKRIVDDNLNTDDDDDDDDDDDNSTALPPIQHHDVLQHKHLRHLKYHKKNLHKKSHKKHHHKKSHKKHH